MRDGPLRVLVDGGLIAKRRGLGRYVRELLYALQQSPEPDLEIYVLIHRSVGRRDLPASGRIRYVRFPGLPLPLWEQLLVPLVASRLRVDVIHCPCNTKSLLLNFLHFRHVVTLHDLIFLRDGGASPYQRLGSLYRRVVVSRMFRGPVHVVTVSRASAREIEGVFGRVPDVVATSVEFFAKSVATDAAAARADPERPYFVHVGGIAPHKNTLGLLEAFRRAGIAGHRLIVLGVPADCALARKWASDSIVFPGLVSDVELARYIAGATAVLFPSLAEGYGLPIIEAFAFGRPVMTSDVPPMNELAGDAALLVNPRSIREMSEACIRLAENARLRECLVRAGRTRLSAFSAHRMGRSMAGIYRAVARP